MAAQSRDPPVCWSANHISTIDADGIALAAIQGLNAKLDASLRDKDDRIAALEQRATEVDSLRAEIAALRRTLAELAREREARVSR